MTTINRYAPDVFVIGAMKAGTSTLWKSMFNNLELAPAKAKEVNYFLNDHSPVSLEQTYRSQFDSLSKIKIDISPNYSRKHIFSGVAGRIHAVNPNAKIVYLIRNPVDRIISHLHHDMFRDRIRSYDLEKIALQDSDYIMTSRYFYQIEDYLRLFGHDQILVIPIELWKHDPQEFQNRMRAFLNIESFQLVKKSYNVAEKRYRIKYHDPVHAAIPNAFLLKLYHYFWYVVNLKVDRPKLSPSVVNAIRIEIAADVEKMRSTFGATATNWL